MPLKTYKLNNGKKSYTLTENPLSNKLTLTIEFPTTETFETPTDDICKYINQIREGQWDSKNGFKQASPQFLPQASPQLLPSKPKTPVLPPLSLGETKSVTATSQPIPTLNFFQSSQKFIRDHKNLFIAASLSGAIGAGIGLTLTFYDQIVSAATITNTLLLGLLAGVVTLIYLFIKEYNKQNQPPSPRN